jgi:hypothetical protein
MNYETTLYNGRFKVQTLNKFFPLLAQKTSYLDAMHAHLWNMPIYHMYTSTANGSSWSKYFCPDLRLVLARGNKKKAFDHETTQMGNQLCMNSTLELQWYVVNKYHPLWNGCFEREWQKNMCSLLGCAARLRLGHIRGLWAAQTRFSAPCAWPRSAINLHRSSWAACKQASISECINLHRDEL